MAHFLVHVNVLVNGRCRQMRFTVDAASARLACLQAEGDVLRTVDGVDEAIADRALRIRDIVRAA